VNGDRVPRDPYPWPYDADLRAENTALLVIDWQIDSCGVGGYLDRMGYDLSVTRAAIAPIQRVLKAVRRAGGSKWKKLRGGRLLGRFSAASRAMLRDTAEHIGMRYVVNLRPNLARVNSRPGAAS
jgi:hypothetical protein